MEVNEVPQDPKLIESQLANPQYPEGSHAHDLMAEVQALMFELNTKRKQDIVVVEGRCFNSKEIRSKLHTAVDKLMTKNRKNFNTLLCPNQRNIFVKFPTIPRKNR
ncbi:hypothetical protein RF11_13816 [Thelohanellus kitauei]|uniref:Uncharacterized protein n=1 Tax=Thelohanellus kitauei TaxID=669202 RepID=A0A0C2M5U1_THEKT|nr:hypothetical protein RF11_13816 [Thelohanellus kitauei]